MHDSIRELIQSQNACVLATSRNNAPHASLMGFVPSEDCSTFFLATYRNTTKFANIQANPEVSLLLDDRAAHPVQDRRETKALTVHGRAEILKDLEQCRTVADILRRRLPHLQDFLNGPDIAFIAVQAVDFLLLQGPTEAIFETADPSDP
ncbi:pyridoxamine 5'-phosphate oxidase family protein [Desulfonatronum lacustre]|uniref:pyridoxamine 5'-phosphate oxidase family protein n=1 Tax=Desulfonatronum lacustre TaxID=66849 RepID=UPI000491CF6C|nr:pyridoxamine 5'-phosphate oxidase family protein [Desulfonatronum lacustre]SMP53504.1 Pyridoxamine 5'-phosphate oxidase [Desulfonatronum zhilinae]